MNIKLLFSMPLVRLFLIAILSFSLTLLSTSSVLAQFTLLPSTPESQPSKNNSIWNINRTYICGEAMCSDVIIDGELLLTVTAPPEVKEDKGSSFSADQRGIKIQNTIKRLIQSRVKLALDSPSLMELTSSLSENKTLSDQVSNVLKEQEVESTQKQQNSSQLPDSFQAEIVDIEIGTLNGETVLYAPPQPGITRQKILTVTRSDSIHNSQSIEELAKTWQQSIQQQIASSIQERLVIARKPLDKFWKASRIFLKVLAFSLAIWLIQRRVRQLHRYKRRELHQLHQSMRIDPESIIHQGTKPNKSSKNTDTKAPNSFFESLWNVPLAHLAVDLQVQAFLEKIPAFTLKRQNVLKQQQNLIYLVRIVLFWIQLFLWFFGIAAIFFVYPATRDYEQVLLIQVITLPLIWLFVTLADRVSDFLTDYFLNRWAEEGQLTNPSDKRYSLRVNTYSPAIKKATTLAFWGLGIFWTIQLLGVPTELVASAGFIGLVVTYFSQNLIKDFFNGALILLTDRYVVGDVVAIGDTSGLVEKLNLYITELRNLDGQLITIPNGSVGTVINMTKEWSRVNFEITVSNNSDIDKVTALLKETADQMQQESNWNDLFLEPLSILGVDEFNYTGVTIRALIKTPPLQQWAVGREFRYRVKQAFDKAGIQIGVPQQNLYFNRSNYSINTNSSRHNNHSSDSQYKN